MIIKLNLGRTSEFHTKKTCICKQLCIFMCTCVRSILKEYIILQWTLIYPDASVSGLFFLETDFFNVILSHLSGIPSSGSGRSVFTTKCIFTFFFVYLSRRQILIQLQVSVHSIWSTFLSWVLIVVKTLTWLTVFTRRRVTMCDRLFVTR